MEAHWMHVAPRRRLRRRGHIGDHGEDEPWHRAADGRGVVDDQLTASMGQWAVTSFTGASIRLRVLGTAYDQVAPTIAWYLREENEPFRGPARCT